MRELIGAYAVGAVTDEERRTVEAHLRTCAECAREARETLDATTALALGVDQIDLPPALRARVVGAMGAVAPVSSAERAHDRRPAGVLPWWMAMAASVAAVGLGLYAVTLRNRIDALEARLRIAMDAAAASERALVTVRAENDATRRYIEVLAAGDLQRVDLNGKAPAAQASGRALWSPSRGLIFTANGLPALPEGRIYQVWIISNAKPIGVALVTPNPSGNAITVVDSPAGVTKADAIAVTLEPAGGVPSPTGQMYLASTP